MTRIELDQLLEKAVADALGLSLEQRPRRARRRTRKSPGAGTTRRA